ncbi:MAG: fatty acid desaturase family protein [Kiloniellaceae bacterium]
MSDEGGKPDVGVGKAAGGGGAGQIDTTQARSMVKDLFAPNPFIYWADFLFSVSVGWASFAAALNLAAFSPEQLVFYVIASLALYRAVIFIHELAHLKKGTFRFFRFVWNVTCGFPLMVPSFTYRGVHNDHHKRDIYGTREDGEYLPFAVERPYKIVGYILLVFVLPLLSAGRFIVLMPLSYLHAGLRRFTWARASSLTIDFDYRRPGPLPRDGKTWKLQELACFLYGVVAILLVATGILSYKALVLWYLIALLIFFLNSLRTLAAHCYRNPGDRTMTLSEQYLDSVNVPGNRILSTLWAPVGLRYHATHHLFPAMPYHALGTAHRRLVRDLPVNGPYLSATRRSLWDALKRLWKEAAAARDPHAHRPVETEIPG